MARRGDGIYIRGKTWWLDFTHQGKRHQERLGRNINRSVARELAAIKRAAILKGEVGIGKRRNDILFDKATEEFLKWAEVNRRPKTFYSYRGCVKQLLKSFSGKRLSDIHPFLIEKHRQRRIKEGALVAVNRELTCLKALFNRYVEWRKFDGANPVRRVKLLKETKGRDRILEPEEDTRLLEASTEPLRTIILTGLDAGLRIQAEALTLRKGDVDLRRDILTVQAAYAKGGEKGSVPINSRLRDALKCQIERSKSEWVFVKEDGVTPYKSIRTAFDSACRRAKLTRVTPHVLRHTFASRLAMAGYDLRTIQELGRWKELTMVQRYAHLSPSHKAEAVERILQNSTTLFTTSKNRDPASSVQVAENK